MILLPFPPSSLSGHANGNSHWRKSAITKEWRERAFEAARKSGYNPFDFADVPDCDIVVMVSFYPPDRRSDRTNYTNRMKPIFDGLADFLEVNDRRFVPEFYYCPVDAPGRVEIRLGLRPGIVWGEAA